MGAVEVQFGIHYGYWAQDWEDAAAPLCRRARRCGFDGLEIGGKLLADTPEKDLDALRSLGEEAQVALIGGLGLPADRNIASTDPQIRQAGKDYLKRTVLAAERAGIRILTGILYASWFYDASKPVRKEETRAHSISSMREIAEFAAEHGVTLMMEVVNRFATYLLNTAAEGAAYVDAVGRDNVKVMLDTFHMNIEEDSFRDAILTAGHRLGYLHVCEGNRKLPGQGRLPWAEIAGALKDISYDGPVVIESIVRAQGSVGHDLKIWRSLSPCGAPEDMDRAAERSLDYLKGLFRG